MNRKEFLKSACKVGLCSCAGIVIFTGTNESQNQEDNKVKQLQGNLDFMHKRFARLIEILDVNLQEEKKNKILMELGSACAKENENYLIQYENNLGGFLDDIQKRWIERVEYKENGTVIKLTGKKTEKCGCPFVKAELTPVEFCNCSKGWQREAFETIIKKPVEVKIVESVLRGGERCSFEIKVT